MTDFQQLDRYLKVDTKQKAADLATLNMLIRHYMLQVPFENINVQNGWPLALTDKAMMHKVVDEHRGGFCYEMNYFFKHYLEYHGYKVGAMSATVMSPHGWARENSHMSLVVAVDDTEYVVDIGFGDMPKFAMPLHTCPAEGMRDVTGLYRVHFADAQHYDVQKWSEAEEEWHIQYRALYQEKSLEDFADGIDFNQYHPDSPFVKGLLITKATETGRHTMTERKLTILSKGEKKALDVKPANYEGLLSKYFGIPEMQIATFDA
ncbi:putative N-acetyltransferase [Staphylococcus piscifermentans]|uniref:Arylamine N-acetyltransferase n=1 Tax=Staphylococcus piscifermentans TaxID=70258 RepID=A0A239UHT1_9STAP|nr:arylamine N-acetyltransferase [Staphylococcus piscifermentans]RTX84419.1 arylamine N-acetyltransferase [Staphylococcus piscifermentans]GEP85467.1 arylamine N-acetyltransferase [Staphylococcus piscifermentans]SNV09587.1 putative N-acetyltransferase [Staphylococcus piscifermentans]